MGYMFLSPEKSFPWNLAGQKDELLFEELKNQLAKKGMPCALINAINREDSSYATRRHKVPVLFLYAKNSEVYRRFIGEPPRMGLIKEDTAKEIRQIWLQLCGKYACNLESCYDENMYIFLNNIQETLCTHALRECKPDIWLFLAQRMHIPVYKVYVSSLPSCNVVFDSQTEYQQSVTLFKEAEGGIRKIVYDHAERILHENMEDVLKICFWHPDMPEYNGYGLARED